MRAEMEMSRAVIEAALEAAGTSGLSRWRSRLSRPTRISYCGGTRVQDGGDYAAGSSF